MSFLERALLLILKENTAIRRRSRGRWRILDAIHIRRSGGQRFLVAENRKVPTHQEQEEERERRAR